jgi:hypothetical protein
LLLSWIIVRFSLQAGLARKNIFLSQADKPGRMEEDAGLIRIQRGVRLFLRPGSFRIVVFPGFGGANRPEIRTAIDR